jgi:hypothetical protein
MYTHIEKRKPRRDRVVRKENDSTWLPGQLGRGVSV